jgi:molybdopterin adenylyltransferase
MIKVGIITVSDKGARGERVDTSGPAIAEMIREINYGVEKTIIVPDEKDLISEAIIGMVDFDKLDLVFTTGGTGFSPRDITPEATMKVIDRYVPGICEVIRQKSLEKTPKAMLSRAVSGIRKQSLIINLPGSEKAVRESLEVILPVLTHGIEILQGKTGECGRK